MSVRLFRRGDELGSPQVDTPDDSSVDQLKGLGWMVPFFLIAGLALLLLMVSVS